MTLVSILGIAGVVINWAVALAGMPHQIYKNFKYKKIEGLSTFTFSLYVVAFTFGLLYGVTSKNMALIVGNVPLVLFSVIILGQIIYYRRIAKKTTQVL
jgi:uncharacterized protein with PQ loop repeat